jgi:AraC family transcriptional regulator
VTAYVRGRRLTEAARVLADGAPDILAVAIQAGYGSHEAFSRAFRDQFGLSLAELRARGHLEGIALVEPLREDPVVPVRLPPPRAGHVSQIANGHGSTRLRTARSGK